MGMHTAITSSSLAWPSQRARIKWLDYMRRYGIATPGTNVDLSHLMRPISRAAPTTPSGPMGSPGFQRQSAWRRVASARVNLLISPLTMAEMTSSVAADGLIVSPHVLLGANTSNQQVISPHDRRGRRKAMWAVVDHGTGNTYPDPHGGPVAEVLPDARGRQIRYGQLEEGSPQSWWISLAPDDQYPNGGSRGEDCHHREQRAQW